MVKNPGQVVTEDVLAALVGEAFVQSHTPLNILGGFKKTGIYPFNPEASDRQLAPSKALKKPIPPPVATFTPAQIAKFEECYKDGYDVEDHTYSAWLNIYHPSKGSVSTCAVTTDISSPGSSVSASLGANAQTSTPDAAISPSVSSSISTPETSASVVTTASAKSLRNSEEVLNELLVFPQAVPSRKEKQLERERKAKEKLEANEKKRVEQERKAHEKQMANQEKAQRKAKKNPKKATKKQNKYLKK